MHTPCLAHPVNGPDHSFRKAWILTPITVILLLLGSGCSDSSTQTVQAEASPANAAIKTALIKSPLRIAVIQDKSLSTGSTRTPQLQAADLEPLVELLGEAAGELAVGVIHDRSNLTFARLRIDVRPEEPVAFLKADNPLERRKQQAAFRKQMEEFNAQQQAWQDEMQLRIGAFQEALEPVLAMRANAQHSPVWDAVQRAELFLTEAEPGGSAVPHRYALLITDGLDDVGARPVPVHSGARLLIVNGAGQLGSLAVLKPQRFESIEAAIRYIVGTETK
jgi:hypothetical protein